MKINTTRCFAIKFSIINSYNLKYLNFALLPVNKFSILITLLWLILTINLNIGLAAPDKIILNDISIKNLEQDDTQIILNFSKTPSIPKVFAIENPAELIIDFPNLINGLSKKNMHHKLSFELVHSVDFYNAKHKVRMGVKLSNLLPYTLNVEGNNLILVIKNQEYVNTTINNLREQSTNYAISALDFNRGPNGEGKLILDLKFEVNDVDIQDNSNNNEIIINFGNASIPSKLLHNFDVSDFATPIKNIIFSKVNKDVVLNIKTAGEYEKIAYHLNGQYIIEAKPKDAVSQQLEKTRKFKFTGEKISLNFQDIEIRAVLQLLADFTGMNIIANDSVSGNVTLRLENIPWDQALDYILKSKGLAKRESGNVVLIAPTEELSKYEEMELSSLKQVEALTPLRTEFIKINYAKADDIVKMIKNNDKDSMLSSRGTISVDARTNTLLLKEIEDKINDIKDLIKILDVPVKQVLIEAYIISAEDSFIDNFGINLYGSAGVRMGHRRLGLSDNFTNAATIANTGVLNSNALTSFGNSAQGNKLGIALSKLPSGILLGLELEAAETETLSTLIAKPKILTLDKQAASIQSGQDIPYLSSSANGGTNTTFQKANLKLEVTPQITPNNQISIDLSINNDKPGTAAVESNGSGTGAIPILTNSLKTNILVEDGETIVLGGLFKDQFNEGVNKIPYLSEIPFIGALFRNKIFTNTKSELLIFITPRIVPINTKGSENNNNNNDYY